MNRKEFAINVTEREAGKKEVSIAQIEEVINCVFDELIAMQEHNNMDALEMIYRQMKAARKRYERDIGVKI